MESDFVCQGRSISTAELDWLRQAVAIHSDWSRKRLARELCQRWQWRTAQGRLKDFAARSLLLKLQTRGLVVLPPLRAQCQTRRWESRPPPRQPPPVATGIERPLAGLQPLRWSLLLAGSLAEGRMHEHLRRHHYLGLHVVGENLKYLVQTRAGQDVACLLFGAAAWQSGARDQFIGWTAAQRAQGLSQAIWNLIEDRFAACLKGLDFYHASIHLWAIAHKLFPEEAKAKAWVQPLLHQLKHGQEAGVLNLLEAVPAQRQAAGPSLSELLQRDLAYFQTHREHLHYQALAAKGSPIGTGAMESTCGQLQTRVKRTGQFWKPAGLANLLVRKAALQNDDWLALWSRN